METSLLFFSFVSSWTLYPNKILSPLSDQYYLRFRNFKWWLIISMNPSITSILWVLNALEYPTPPSLTSEKDSVSRRVKTQPIGYFLFFFQIHLGDYIQETMALTSLVNVSFMRTSWESGWTKPPTLYPQYILAKGSVSWCENVGNLG